jgi:hypothetical protein
VAPTTFQFLRSMSPLADDQVGTTMGVGAPLVVVQMLIPAERLIVSGASEGDHVTLVTLGMTQAPGENMLDVRFGCTDTRLTHLQGPLGNTSFAQLFHDPVLLVGEQGNLLELQLQV